LTIPIEIELFSKTEVVQSDFDKNQILKVNMSAITQAKDVNPWFKEPWPWILMTGPFVVICAGIVTTWLAVVSNDGLVSDDYYKQGMTVNQRLQRDHQARDMGMHADVMFSVANVRLLLTAKQTNTYPDKVTVKLMHPTMAGRDQNVLMTSEGQGFYSGQMTEQISGRWHVSIEDPANQWRLQGDWQAESMEPLRLGVQTEK
jgi:hypothetical protein